MILLSLVVGVDQLSVSSSRYDTEEGRREWRVERRNDGRTECSIKPDFLSYSKPQISQRYIPLFDPVLHSSLLDSWRSSSLSSWRVRRKKKSL